MQAKLDEVKLELQKITAHWKKEWKEMLAKWSDKIIVSSDSLREELLLPTDLGEKYILAHKLTSESKFYCSKYDLEDAAFYRYSAYAHLCIPINLALDVFRHLVLAFGGSFFTGRPTTKNPHYYNPRHSYFHWLWVNEEDKRHHQVIRNSLQSTYANVPKELDDHNRDSGDRWELVQLQGIQLGGKLLSTHYIRAILKGLKEYQMTKMFEYHFRHFDEKGRETIAVCQRLFQMLSYRTNYRDTTTDTVELVDLAGSRVLVHLPKPNSQGSDNGEQKAQKCEREREAAKQFELNAKDWSQILEGSSKTDEFEKLSLTDVHFVISCFIDMECDHKETLEKIEKIDKTVQPTQLPQSDSTTTANTGAAPAFQFPTVDDDFSSFDPLHLRGLLAETVLSRKLKGYVLGREEIFTGGFAATAPTALTEIVADYYPVDLPHPHNVK